MSARPDNQERNEPPASEQHETSTASLLVEAVAAAVALAFTILLLVEVLPFLQ